MRCSTALQGSPSTPRVAAQALYVDLRPTVSRAQSETLEELLIRRISPDSCVKSLWCSRLGNPSAPETLRLQKVLAGHDTRP